MPFSWHWDVADAAQLGPSLCGDVEAPRVVVVVLAIGASEPAGVDQTRVSDACHQCMMRLHLQIQAVRVSHDGVSSSLRRSRGALIVLDLGPVWIASFH